MSTNGTLLTFSVDLQFSGYLVCTTRERQCYKHVVSLSYEFDGIQARGLTEGTFGK